MFCSQPHKNILSTEYNTQICLLIIHNHNNYNYAILKIVALIIQRMNINYLISIIIQSFLFIYWICIGYYFYKKDTKKRHDQQIKATLREIHHNKIDEENNNKNEGINKFSGFMQWQFRLSIWYSGIEILSLFFNFDHNELKMTNTSQDVANIVAINLIYLDYIYFISFGVSFLLYTISIIHSSYLWKYSSSSVNARFEQLQLLLFESLLIPSLATFNSILVCTSNGENIKNIDIISWFDPIHLILMLLSVIMVTIISFYALYYKHQEENDESKPSQSQFVFMERFISIWVILQILMAGLKAFFLEYIYVVLPFILILTIYMEYFIIKHQPCLGIGKVFNAHFAAMFAVLIYAGFVSFIIVLIKDYLPFAGFSEIIFFIGMPFVIKIAWIQSKKRQTILNNQTLQKCESIFDHTVKIRDRIGIANDALILSMTTEKISELMDLFLNKNASNMVKILQKNKYPEFSIVLLQCITNLAVISEEHRQQMFDIPNFIRVLLRYVNSGKKATLKLEFPRAVFGLLCNICFESECKQFITKKVLLDIVTNLESSSDKRLREYAASMMLMLVGLKDIMNSEKQNEIKQWIVETDVIIKHIWWLITNQNLDYKLKQKALKIIYHVCDKKDRVDKLLRNKHFDIDQIVDIKSSLSEKIVDRMGKVHYIPKKIRLKSISAKTKVVKEQRRLSFIERWKEKLFKVFGRVSDKLEINNSIQRQLTRSRNSKHAVFVDLEAANLEPDESIAKKSDNNQLLDNSE